MKVYVFRYSFGYVLLFIDPTLSISSMQLVEFRLKYICGSMTAIV